MQNEQKEPGKIRQRVDAVKDKLKQNKIGELFGRLSKKAKMLVIIGVIALVILAIVVAVILNRSSYVVLFSGLSDEEATRIVGKLQDDDINYSYKGDGVILVDEAVADQTRANLAYEGYPKTGFSYDVFTENAGGMTTDTEKQTYKLYDLQNRIGATVMLFDGVKDAKVTIALQEEKKYALEDDDADENSSASVVVTMEDGGSPSAKQAAAIQRLVAKSVPGMQMENVAVFDGNGIDVSAETDGGATSGDASEEIAQIIENQITKKVINVLGPFYGADNIRVSAKGQVNMERVVRETTTYETPEKIDQNDKTGIVSSENLTYEQSNGGATTGGVAGSETNADISEYTNRTGDQGSTYTSETQAREYLVNQIKEQGEIDPGVLTDLTVSVSINGNTLGNLTEAEARSLVANATGINQEEQNAKITIVAAPFYQDGNGDDNGGNFFRDNIVFIGSGLVLLLLLGLLALLLIRRKKKKAAEEEELEEENFFIPPVMEEEEGDGKPEILNLKSEKTRELRENVRNFANENPEISAQMIKNWLNGGDQDGGNN